MRQAEALRKLDTGEWGSQDFLKRLSTDFELFSEVCLKIVDKGGNLIPFVFNEAQSEFHIMVEDQKTRLGIVRKILVKARQWGGTTYIAGRFIWNCWRNKHKHAQVVAHTQSATEKIFKMYQTYVDNLPLEMRPQTRSLSSTEIAFDNPSKDPVERQRNPGLGSSIGVFSAGGRGALRGSTVQYLHCSEVPSWEDPKKFMLAALATVPNEDELRMDTEVFIESTAEGIGDWFHQKYQAAKNKAEGEVFEAVFIPWYLHTKYSRQVGYDLVLTEEERRLVEDEHPEWQYVNPATGSKRLSVEQIAWKRETLRTGCDGDLLQFQQEYPLTDEEAFVSKGACYFNVDMIQIRQKALANVHPIFTGELEVRVEGSPADRDWNSKVDLELRYGAIIAVPTEAGRLRVWRKPEEGHKYVIVADVSEGYRSSDYSVVGIFDKKDGFQCATFRSRIDPHALGDVYILMARYYNDAYGSPEVNAGGLACLKRLQQLHCRHLHQRKEYEKRSVDPIFKVGFRTTPALRSMILAQAARMFRDDEVVINDPFFLGEMLTFVEDPDSGKYEAQDGCFDDCVMTLAIGCQLLQEVGGMRKVDPDRLRRRVHGSVSDEEDEND